MDPRLRGDDSMAALTGVTPLSFPRKRESILPLARALPEST